MKIHMNNAVPHGNKRLSSHLRLTNSRNEIQRPITRIGTGVSGIEAGEYRSNDVIHASIEKTKTAIAPSMDLSPKGLLIRVPP